MEYEQPHPMCHGKRAVQVARLQDQQVARAQPYGLLAHGIVGRVEEVEDLVEVLVVVPLLLEAGGVLDQQHVLAVDVPGLGRALHMGPRGQPADGLGPGEPEAALGEDVAEERPVRAGEEQRAQIGQFALGSQPVQCRREPAHLMGRGAYAPVLYEVCAVGHQHGGGDGTQELGRRTGVGGPVP